MTGRWDPAFMFKPKVKEHTYSDLDVYLVIEKLN
jgi:hypothetical protein